MADIFDVIADATRRDILSQLLDGPASTAALGKALGIDDAAKQLTVLSKAGLVVANGEGAKKVWSLDPSPLQDVDGWLVPFLEAAGAFGAEGAGSVFGAWSGSGAGESIGRAIADRSHSARVVIEEATEKAKTKLPKSVVDRLGKRAPKES
jgi:DNA-binding transcriptional ArsR family regulator